MYKYILAGCALIIPAAMNAQTRPVRATQNAAAARAHPGHWKGRVVHAGAYHGPHGYAYRRWTVGHALPRAYLAPTYYYRDYAALGLYAPQAHFQWIRYGPDLVLVDVRTGNIADIRYGVFG